MFVNGLLSKMNILLLIIATTILPAAGRLRDTSERTDGLSWVTSYFGVGKPYFHWCNCGADGRESCLTSREGGCDTSYGDEQCKEGYFGPKCQYAALTYTTPALTLMNSDVTSCMINPEQRKVTFTLSRPHPLTWIRVYLTELVWFETPRVYVKRLNSVIFEEVKNVQAAKVDKNRVDIVCPSDEVVQDIVLEGKIVSKLCSVAISGGRNLAVDMPVYQSSIRANGFGDKVQPWRAVDGFETCVAKDLCCAYTLEAKDDKEGVWNLTFPFDVMVNRILISNTDFKILQNDTTKMTGFDFTMYAGSEEVYRHTSPDNSSQHSYTIVPYPKVKQVVSSIQIAKSKRSDRLKMCELMVFGERVCPPGKFGLYCHEDCNCRGGGECFVHSGGCPSGCKDRYFGEACSTYTKQARPDWAAIDPQRVCPKNKFGRTCRFDSIGYTGPPWLTDNDKYTCNSDTTSKQAITLVLEIPIRVTWFRFIFNSNGFVKLPVIYSRDKFWQFIQCKFDEVYIVDYRDHNRIVDVYCPTKTTSDNIILMGTTLKDMCSFHVLYDNTLLPTGHLPGCPRGKWGMKCVHQCNCRVNKYCHRVSGSCTDGCKPGYTGPDCWVKETAGLSETYFGKDGGKDHWCGCDTGVECDKYTGLCKGECWNWKIGPSFSCLYRDVRLIKNASITMRRVGNFALHTQELPQKMLCDSSLSDHQVHVRDVVLTVLYNEPYTWMDWIRITTRNLDLKNYPDVHILEQNSDTFKACSGMPKWAAVDDNTAEALCSTSKPPHKIRISGPGTASVCAVHIILSDDYTLKGRPTWIYKPGHTLFPIECPHGKFGVFCNRDCNCLEGSCYSHSGGCPAGCKPGYTGEDCWQGDVRDDGWFGYQPLMCHCKHGVNCDKVTGDCPGSCADGWFGPACQYESIKYEGPWWLTDNNEQTCGPAAKSVSIFLSKPTTLTWIRFVVQNSDAFQPVLLYQNTKKEFVSCGNIKWATVDDKTVDLVCESDTATTTIQIQTPWICSMTISGGRDMAIKQRAQLRGMLMDIFYTASVDRLTTTERSAPDDVVDCMKPFRIDLDRHWHLVFRQPVKAHRVLIYSRVNKEIYSSTTKVKVYNGIQNTELIGNSIVETTGSFRCETLQITHGSRNVTAITFEGLPTVNPKPVLICQIHVMGENLCPQGKWGLFCMRDCECPGGGQCFVHSGGCPRNV